MRKIRALFTLFVFVSITFFGLANAEEDQEYLIRSGMREFVPQAGQMAELQASERHLIVQFYDIPDSEIRGSLAKRGINLVRYIGGNAYVATVSDAGRKELASLNGIRASMAHEPDMKLSSLFESICYLRSAIAEDQLISVRINFHQDVNFEDALRILESEGLSTDRGRFLFFRAIELEAPWSVIEQLLQVDEIAWIDPSMPAARVDNVRAANRSNVNFVYKKRSFRKPVGRGINVGVWDSGQVSSHKDFGNRVTIVETDKDISSHATHVSGTIGGSGKGNKNARGMATEVEIFSYNFEGDPTGEMKQAIDDYGIMISNNSWGGSAGWFYVSSEVGAPEKSGWYWDDPKWFGYYHSNTEDADRLVRENNFAVVRSAGNQRNNSFLGPHYHWADKKKKLHHDLHAPNPEYGCMSTWAIGKNVITVGAVMDDDYITAFSSFGPTGDGRLKPDVVANGYELISTDIGDKYKSSSGTSMSAPVVTGISALLMQTYKSFHKTEMGADVLKGVLIHTARDLGPEGPDYKYGFGIVDAEMAAKLITSSAKNPLYIGDGPRSSTQAILSASNDLSGAIIEGSIDNKEKNTFEISVPNGVEELRITMVWHDEPGDTLINDLDLWAGRPKGGLVRPFTLNPNKPSLRAKQKRNGRDNVEHVRVNDPDGGGWKIFVRGKKVPQGPQRYILIVSAGKGNASPVIKTEGKVHVLKVWTGGADKSEKSSYSSGDPLSLWFDYWPEANADYGDFYGTVTQYYLVWHGKDLILRKINCSDSIYGCSPGGYWTAAWDGFQIVPDLAAGTYTFEAIVIMANGSKSKGKWNFTVK